MVGGDGRMADRTGDGVRRRMKAWHISGANVNPFCETMGMSVSPVRVTRLTPRARGWFDATAFTERSRSTTPDLLIMVDPPPPVRPKIGAIP